MGQQIDTITEIIKDNYPLPPLAKVNLLRSGPDNDIFLVTDQANQLKKFVVRVSKRELNRADIVFETTWLAELNRQGVPVPKIIPTKQGQNFYFNGRQIYTAFAYIEGESFKLDRETKPNLNLVKSAAQTLAQIHNVSFNSPLHLPRKRYIFTEIDRILAHQDKFDQPLVDYLLFYKNWVKRNMGSDYFLVHNDYRPGNILLKGDKVTAVLDFDWSYLGPAIKDVAHSLVEWSFPDGAKQPWPDVFKTFLTAYNQVAKHPVTNDSDLIHWTCFACLSDTATYLADMANEGIYPQPPLSYMYQKFLYFLQIN